MWAKVRMMIVCVLSDLTDYPSLMERESRGTLLLVLYYVIPWWLKYFTLLC